MVGWLAFHSSLAHFCFLTRQRIGKNKPGVGVDRKEFLKYVTTHILFFAVSYRLFSQLILPLAAKMSSPLLPSSLSPKNMDAVLRGSIRTTIPVYSIVIVRGAV